MAVQGDMVSCFLLDRCEQSILEPQVFVCCSRSVIVEWLSPLFTIWLVFGNVSLMESHSFVIQPMFGARDNEMKCAIIVSESLFCTRLVCTILPKIVRTILG